MYVRYSNIMWIVRLKKIEKVHETLLMKHDLLKSVQFWSDQKKILEFKDTQRDSTHLRYFAGSTMWVISVIVPGKSEAHHHVNRKDIELSESIEVIFGEVEGIYGSPKK